MLEWCVLFQIRLSKVTFDSIFGEDIVPLILD